MDCVKVGRGKTRSGEADVSVLSPGEKEGSPTPGSVEIELGVADAASGDGESFGHRQARHDEAAGQEEPRSRGLSDSDSQEDSRNQRAQRGQQQGAEGGKVRLPGEGEESGNDEETEGPVERSPGLGAGWFRTCRRRGLWRGNGLFHAEGIFQSPSGNGSPGNCVPKGPSLGALRRRGGQDCRTPPGARPGEEGVRDPLPPQELTPGRLPRSAVPHQ